jgi:hypothetical protein
MEGLVGCRCCGRHQDLERDKKTCACHCRHYTRLFKRKKLA